jgi:hypothetical protein
VALAVGHPRTGAIPQNLPRHRSLRNGSFFEKKRKRFFLKKEAKTFYSPKTRA